MNKVGWTILAAILLIVGGFVLLQLPMGPGPDPADEMHDESRPLASDDAAMIVPVVGIQRAQIVDSWHDARGGGGRVHEGLDIIAPRGTPVVAAHAGRVEKLFQSALGGTTAYVRSGDGATVTYYAHLAGYAPGLREGQTLSAGDAIGYVGNSGDAGVDHLHFAVNRMRPGENWYQGTAINPYPLLAGKASVR